MIYMAMYSRKVTIASIKLLRFYLSLCNASMTKKVCRPTHIS